MTRTHPLVRLARQQKRDLSRLTRHTEDGVHSAFWYARRSVDPTIGEFTRAYGAELERAKAAMDETDLFAHVPLHWLLSSGWGQRVKSALATAAQMAGQQSAVHITQAHATAAYIGHADASELLNTAMRPAVEAGMQWIGQPALIALDQRILGKAGNGGPLGALFDGFGAEASKRAQGVLYSALVSGTNPRAIAGQLAGALDIGRNRALVICRTELLTAYRSAQLENYRANSDVVQQWLWSAAPGACIACVEMDGQTFDLDVSQDSHPNCRCACLPVTKSWDDILSPLGIDSSDLPDTRITADYQSAGDAFEQADEATQLATLGPAKLAAWQAGDIDLSDLVGQRDDGAWGNPIYEKSLKELGLDASDYLGD